MKHSQSGKHPYLHILLNSLNISKSSSQTDTQIAAMWLIESLLSRFA